MMKRWRLWRMILAFTVVFAALGSGGESALASKSGIFYPAPSPGAGITWEPIYTGLDFRWKCDQCPYSLGYWGGYKLNGSVSGAHGHHYYASADRAWWDATAIANMKADQSSALHPSRPSFKFDFQTPVWGWGELHATGWFYTNLPSAEGWSEDDVYGSWHEEFTVWWDAYGLSSGYGYLVDIEYWDPHSGSQGEINLTQLQTLLALRVPQPWSDAHLTKFCFWGGASAWVGTCP